MDEGANSLVIKCLFVVIKEFIQSPPAKIPSYLISMECFALKLLSVYWTKQPILLDFPGGRFQRFLPLHEMQNVLHQKLLRRRGGQQIPDVRRGGPVHQPERFRRRRSRPGTNTAKLMLHRLWLDFDAEFEGLSELKPVLICSFYIDCIRRTSNW